jgi:hypothetical protein
MYMYHLQCSSAVQLNRSIRFDLKLFLHDQIRSETVLHNVPINSKLWPYFFQIVHNNELDVAAFLRLFCFQNHFYLQTVDLQSTSVFISLTIAVHE